MAMCFHFRKASVPGFASIYPAQRENSDVLIKAGTAAAKDVKNFGHKIHE
jgi:hypothetical protein